jgi:ABC-2 type transport system permease protein
VTAWARQTAALFLKEVKILCRDRQALALLFAMPAVFVVVLSVALQGAYDEKVGGHLTVAIDNEDGGALGRRVQAILEARPEWRVVPLPPGTGGHDALAAGRVKARIEIPVGFTKDLEDYSDAGGREPFGSHRVIWETDPVLDATTRWFVRATIALAVQEAMLDDLAASSGESEDAPPPPRDAETFAVDAAAGRPGWRWPTPLQQTVPGWALFAMFFVAVPLAGGVIRERGDGSMRRIRTYPVAGSAVVVGKLLPYVLVNGFQFAIMMAAGMWVVPLFGPQALDPGRHPWHLVPVTIAAAMAATGFGVLVASIARTAEQAGALAATAIIVMAACGGIMVPVFVMPRVMQYAALASPLYWAHQAYLDVFIRDAALPEIAPRLFALAAFSAGCVAIAAWRLRRG